MGMKIVSQKTALVIGHGIVMTSYASRSQTYYNAIKKKEINSKVPKLSQAPERDISYLHLNLGSWLRRRKTNQISQRANKLGWLSRQRWQD
jgi:hypothetical protein